MAQALCSRLDSVLRHPHRDVQVPYASRGPRLRASGELISPHTAVGARAAEGKIADVTVCPDVTLPAQYPLIRSRRTVSFSDPLVSILGPALEGPSSGLPSVSRVCGTCCTRATKALRCHPAALLPWKSSLHQWEGGSASRRRDRDPSILNLLLHLLLQEVMAPAAAVSARSTPEGSMDGLTLKLPAHGINEADNFYTR